MKLPGENVQGKKKRPKTKLHGTLIFRRQTEEELGE